MNITKFTIYTTLGSLIWNIVLITLGHIVGSNWKSILKIFDLYSTYAVVIIFIISIVLIIKFYKKKLKE